MVDRANKNMDKVANIENNQPVARVSNKEMAGVIKKAIIEASLNSGFNLSNEQLVFIVDELIEVIREEFYFLKPIFQNLFKL